MDYSRLVVGQWCLWTYIGMTDRPAGKESLFLGWWSGPILPPIVWFFLKTGLFICLFILLRATFPRPRFDQLLAFGWKVMLPVSLANLLVTGAVVLAQG